MEKLVYNTIHFILKCISCIPVKKAVKISHIFGNIVYVIDSRHRKVALRNLAYACGVISSNITYTNIARKVYRNLCQSLFEISWVAKGRIKNLEHDIKVTGSRNLENSLLKKRGIIFISGHIGAWELLPYVISRMGIIVNIVYRPLDFGPLDKLTSELRSMFGARLIPTKGAIPKISQALEKNETVGLLIDQSSDWYNGVWVDFFGHRTCTSKGAARIALKTGTPVIPVFIFRKGNKFEVCFHEAIPSSNTGDMTKDIEINTANYTKVIEREIRKYPEQWFWVHRRWKNKASSPFPREREKLRVLCNNKNEAGLMINEDLLSIIVCPGCKGKVELDKIENHLVCKNCNLAYEIKKNIPIMIVERAKKLGSVRAEQNK